MLYRKFLLSGGKKNPRICKGNWLYLILGLAFFFLFSFHSCKGIQLFRFQTWSLPGWNLNLGVRIPCQTCLSGDLSGGCSTGYYHRVAPGSPSVSISQVMAFYRPGSHQDLIVALKQPSFSRNSSTLFSPKSSKSVRTEKLISKGPFLFYSEVKNVA